MLSTAMLNKGNNTEKNSLVIEDSLQYSKQVKGDPVSQ